MDTGTKAASIAEREIAGSAICSLASQIFQGIWSNRIPAELRQRAFGAWYELRRLGQRISQRPGGELHGLMLGDVIDLFDEAHAVMCEAQRSSPRHCCDHCPCHFSACLRAVFPLVFELVTLQPTKGGRGQSPEQSAGRFQPSPSPTLRRFLDDESLGMDAL